MEYKTSGWSLSQNRKQIAFTGKKGIGQLKLKGTRADGYYVQFLVNQRRVARMSMLLGQLCQFHNRA